MKLRFADPAPEAYRPPLTIKHLLNGLLGRAGDQKIIYRDQSSYDYAEFHGRIARLANLLETIGATAGMTVAVMDWDSHRYLEAYFAVPMMGAVLQTVNVRMTPSQIAYTLEKAQAEVLLVHRDFFPIVQEILPDLRGIKVCIAIMDGAVDPLPEWSAGEYEALSAFAASDYPFVDFDENAIATTFFTTGTTGNPKGVFFSHRQLVLHTLAAAGAFGASTASPGLGAGDVYMPLTPMFHVHAWGLPYVATMLGLRQVYPGRYESQMICKLRQQYGVTYSHGVPTVLRMMIDAAHETKTDLSGWKMTIGGSVLTKALCAEARSLGMSVGTGYGMSETCPFISKTVLRSPDCDEDEILSVMTMAGVSMPLLEARVVDDAMNAQPWDGQTRGELVLRAPWLTQGYLGDPAASDELWRGGWLHTQDVATIDPAGNMQIRDRMKDVIKTGGEWIDSIHLEELVASAEGIREASVVAVADRRWGERPLAFVVPEPGVDPTIETLNIPVLEAIASGTITPYAKLDRFEVISELPRTSVGKIDKKALRARVS